MSACHATDQYQTRYQRLMLWMSLLIILALTSGLPVQALAFEAQASDAQVGAVDKTVVGRVTLAIGQGQIVHDNDTQDQARTGTLIREGDQVVTRSNGHVHIRFIDDGLVSVRPNSRLDIERYQYNTAHPEDSIIRFNLEEGVTRAVSGKGAKAARDRYRMNTPIAAIGVRGTDYVLSANADRIRAFVNEGAIVVAAFSDQCLASALGPCNTTGVELKGDSNQVLELQKAFKQPRLLQMNVDDALNASILSEQATPVEAHAVQEEDQEETQTDGSKSHSSSRPADKPDVQLNETPRADTPNTEPEVSDDTANSSDISVFKPLEPVQEGSKVDDQMTGSSENNGSSDQNKAQVQPMWGSILIVGGAQGLVMASGDNEPMKPDDLFLTPFVEKELLPPVAQQRQLVWGHWGDETTSAPEFVYPYRDIDDGRDVKLSSIDYLLLRNRSDLSTLMPGLGEVNFTLTNASASLTQDDQTKTPMDVLAGALKIDFNNQRFSTALTLDSDLTGNVAYYVKGDVDSDGLMRSDGSFTSSLLSGATSLDGQEAAYIFMKRIREGLIEGITLWDAQ